MDAVAATDEAPAITYTASGEIADGTLIKSSMTLHYNDATNPIAIGDLVAVKLQREMTTDTYAAHALIYQLTVGYSSISFREY